MHVGCTNPNFGYFMNGEKLMETTSEQNIGVLTDKSLKLSNQCITAARVANAVLSKICQAFHIQQVTNARKVNCSHVYSAYILKPVLSVRLVSDSEEDKSIQF